VVVLDFDAVAKVDAAFVLEHLAHEHTGIAAGDFPCRVQIGQLDPFASGTSRSLIRWK
jgi:hypothetical protein